MGLSIFNQSPRAVSAMQSAAPKPEFKVKDAQVKDFKAAFEWVQAGKALGKNRTLEFKDNQIVGVETPKRFFSRNIQQVSGDVLAAFEKTAQKEWGKKAGRLPDRRDLPSGSKAKELKRTPAPQSSASRTQKTPKPHYFKLEVLQDSLRTMQRRPVLLKDAQVQDFKRMLDFVAENKGYTLGVDQGHLSVVPLGQAKDQADILKQFQIAGQAALAVLKESAPEKETDIQKISDTLARPSLAVDLRNGAPKRLRAIAEELLQACRGVKSDAVKKQMNRIQTSMEDNQRQQRSRLARGKTALEDIAPHSEVLKTGTKPLEATSKPLNDTTLEDFARLLREVNQHNSEHPEQKKTLGLDGKGHLMAKDEPLPTSSRFKKPAPPSDGDSGAILAHFSALAQISINALETGQLHPAMAPKSPIPGQTSILEELKLLGKIDLPQETNRARSDASVTEADLRAIAAGLSKAEKGQPKGAKAALNAVASKLSRKEAKQKLDTLSLASSDASPSFQDPKPLQKLKEASVLNFNPGQTFKSFPAVLSQMERWALDLKNVEVQD